MEPRRVTVSLGKEDALDKINTEIAEKLIKFVFLEYCDLHGLQRGRVISSGRFIQDATKGFMMSGMPLFRLPTGGVPPMKHLPLSVEFNDLRFIPDLGTFKSVPWRKNIASVIVDPCNMDGNRVSYSSREVARNQVERLEKYGLQIFSSLEYEFAALRAKTLEPIHNDTSGHLIKQFFKDWDYLEELHDGLENMGLEVEQIDSEGECAVYEFPMKPSDGLQAGDNGFWLKKTIRELSQRRGYLASFSSKPFLKLSGLSGHFNHSLKDMSGKMLFHDDNEFGKMSKTMRHWLAGLIRHAPAMAIFGCPTASCQRRFTHFDRATPLYPNWGIDNRTCSFRVKNHAPENTYIENRIFAAGCNPYLALAVNIAAGLDGIINELRLPEMVEGDGLAAENVPPGAHRFSGKLVDAVEALEKDDVLCDALGEDFTRTYLNAKIHECKKEKQAITSGDSAFYDREYLHHL